MLTFLNYAMSVDSDLKVESLEDSSAASSTSEPEQAIDEEPPIHMDEVCLRLHDELFSRNVSATRKSAIIFQFKVSSSSLRS
jgi:hypothetical protein